MAAQHTHEPRLSLVIIDDNPGSLEMLSSALYREGLDIFTADEPNKGLDLVFTKHPAIVLTDLVMPNMNGMQVLWRITGFDPMIDVVFLTAPYTTETAVEAIKRGAAD